MPVGGGFGGCSCGGSDCPSLTTPIATTGLCLPDGTPLAVIIERDCSGNTQQTGWMNLTTGAYTTGVPPAGAAACGDSRSIQVSGVLCDLAADGTTLLGLVLVEYHYADDGSIDSVRLVSAATGETYTLQGTLAICPGDEGEPGGPCGSSAPLVLCDVAGEAAPAAVPLDTLPPAPQTGTLPNGVTWSVDAGAWLAGNGYLASANPGQPYPQGPQTWTFDQPVNLRIAFASFNNNECAQLPPGLQLDSLAPHHVWDPDQNRLCGQGATAAEATWFTTTSPVTSFTWYTAIDGAVPNAAVGVIGLDVTPAPTATRFLRHVRSACDGTITTTDTTLDGQPYTPVGTVQTCTGGTTGDGGSTAASASGDVLVLCDIADDGTTTSFLRRLHVTAVGTVTTTDTALDGTTPYTPLGTVGTCTAPCQDSTTLLLCDTAPAPVAMPVSPPAGTQGTLSNGVSWVRSGLAPGFGVPTWLTGLPGTQGGWTFDQEVTAAFGITFGGPGVCVVLPAGSVPQTVHANHVWDEASGILCASDQASPTDLSTVTHPGATALVFRPSDSGASGRVTVHDLTVGQAAHTFLRSVCRDAAGQVTTVTDTELDGQTPYVPTGSVVVCRTEPVCDQWADASGGMSVLPLCDIAPDGTVTAFLRHITSTADGVTVTDTTLDGTTPYTVTGTVGVCASADDEESPGEPVPCHDSATVLLCDDPAPDGVPPLPVTSTTTDTDPTPYFFTFHNAALAGGAQALWDGGTTVFPAETSNAATGAKQVHRCAAGIITSTRPACDDGTATVTAAVEVRNAGPNPGILTNGRMRLLTPDGATLATSPIISSVGVGSTRHMTVSAPVDAATASSGVIVWIDLETWDEAGSGGVPAAPKSWEASAYTATVEYGQGGCVQAVQFLRTIVTDCETGQTLTTTDTTLDGQPYTVTGQVGQCRPAQDCCPVPPPETRVDVESDLMCAVDPATGTVTAQVLVERVYDNQTGDRTLQRLTDPTTGEPVELPDGAELVLCQDPPCPSAFSTECVGAVTRTEAGYDNTSLIEGVPGQCGSVQGPGGQFPCQPARGGYTITSWIVNGQEVIGDGGGRAFNGGPCGEGTAAAPGMHLNWAQALTNLDPSGATWAAQTAPGCAWYVGSTGGTRTVYGPMTVVDAAGQQWILGPAQECEEIQYTKVYSQECDGTVTVSWLDAQGIATDPPEGDLVPCGTGCGAGAGSGLDVEVLTLCDIAPDGSSSPFLRHITYGSGGQPAAVTDTALDGFAPYTPSGTVGICGPGSEPCRDTASVLLCDAPADSTVTVSPDITDATGADVGLAPAQFPDLSGPYTPLWTGGTLTWPAGTGPGQVNPVATGRITAAPAGCDSASGTLTVSVRVTQNGPGAGQLWDGALRLYQGTTLLAAQDVTTYAPVGHVQTLTVTVPVTAADLAAGTLYAAVILETFHGTAKGWTADQFTASVALEGCEASTPVQFLRSVVTDCETGRVVATSDSTLSGQPYIVTGTVGQCVPADNSGGDCCPTTETLALCDTAPDGTVTGFLRHLVYTPGIATAVSAIDTALDGSTPYTASGTVGVCGPAPDEESPGEDCTEFLHEECRWDDTDGDGVGDVPYVELIAVDACTGALSTVGTYAPGLTGPYEPVAPVEEGPAAAGPPARGVQAHRLVLPPGASWDAQTVPLLQSVSVVARGTAMVTTADGVSGMVAGESIGWSVARETDAALTGPLTVTAGDGPVAVAWTAGVVL
ncbi:hypothetical protein [Streptomyces sp. SPB074]|uniref:hypothetical protein n=1 Tax=Streptomyces sp. (strain SPB074) TaxID=465543 RepID=UPI00131A3425|nr:hypothetical protein [Streptomyces sp. SPB074]